MKKLLLAAALLLMLCGCGANDEEVVFSVSEEQETAYKDIIAAELKPYSKSYNPDMITFAAAQLPIKGDSYYSELDTAVSDGGAKVSALIGKDVVEADVTLENINGDHTGKAVFYFAEGELVCGYYEYNSKLYSLDCQNPFEINDGFSAYEDTDIFSTFNESSFNGGFTSVSAVNNGIVAVIEENGTVMYYDGTKSFAPCAKVDYTGKGLIPLDVTLGDDFGTILLGKRDELQQVEDENEVSDTVSESPADSVSIAVTDSIGKPLNIEIPTTVSSLKSLAQVGNRLFIARDKSIDEFTYEAGKLTKVKTYVLEHYVSTIRTADIDGSGTTEFIVSDGTNLYIYEKKSTFNMIWRSSSYLSSVSSDIYAGDLNGDGVKEIYLTDSTGVTARYILTEQGFKISGGGIMTGNDDGYIIADFNNDGRDDYIRYSADGGYAGLFTAD